MICLRFGRPKSFRETDGGDLLTPLEIHVIHQRLHEMYAETAFGITRWIRPSSQGLLRRRSVVSVSDFDLDGCRVGVAANSDEMRSAFPAVLYRVVAGLPDGQLQVCDVIGAERHPTGYETNGASYQGYIA